MQSEAASAKPFHQRQATAVGIVLVVVGGLSILFNIIDLCIGTGVRDDRWNSYNCSLRRTISHESLGVAAHGFWAGAIVSDRGFV